MKSRIVSLAAAGILIAAASSTAHAQVAGNSAAGKALFTQQCMACHSTAPGQEGAAPNLLGVVGRKAGSDPGFTSYTTALKASKLIWTPATLDKFLTGPATLVPGTAMPISLSSPTDRHNVIAYLANLKH